MFYNKIEKLLDNIQKIQYNIHDKNVMADYNSLCSIRDAAVFEISNIKDYFLEFDDYSKLQDHVYKYTNIAPPYKNMFFEYGNAMEVYRKIFIELNPNVEVSAGLPAELDITSGVHMIYHDLTEIDIKKDLQNKYNIKYICEARMIFNINVRNDYIGCLVTNLTFLIDVSGRLLAAKNIHDTILQEYSVTLLPYIDELYAHLGLKKITMALSAPSDPHFLKVFNELFKYFDNNSNNELYVATILHMCYMALTFTHCKNVKTVEIDPLDELSNTKRKKIIRSGNLPKRYNVIKIQPMRTDKSTAPYLRTNYDSYELTIRRGHFKDYREGKGLFGKFKGLYWWEDQEYMKERPKKYILDGHTSAHMIADELLKD